MEYQLCQEAKVDPVTVLNALNTFASSRVRSYLEWTRDYVKYKPTINPTGLFITAIQSGYNIDFVQHSKRIDSLVPPEVVAVTHKEMMDAIESDLQNSPPLSPDSPFYKYAKHQG